MVEVCQGDNNIYNSRKKISNTAKNTSDVVGEVLKIDWKERLTTFIKKMELDVFDNELLEYFLNCIEDENKNTNIDLSDEEFLRYVEENLLHIKKGNLSRKKILKGINKSMSGFLNQYKEMKTNIDSVIEKEGTKFGISVTFILIELFEIAEKCNNEEDFKKERDEYFRKLGENESMKRLFVKENIEDLRVYTNVDSLVEKHDVTTQEGYNGIIKDMFPGIKDVTLKQIQNIYDNILLNSDYISPEVSGKMRLLIDTSKSLFNEGNVNTKAFDFTFLDKIANFAREHNMKLRLHTIIWYKDFLPSFKELTKDQLYTFLDVYMEELAKRYSDVLYAVDVLNEIASDEDPKYGFLRENPWREKLGDDYYIEVLRIAKKHFPDGVELYYNEYGEERGYKRKHIIEIIERIKSVEEKENITLLDGLGIQSHYSNTVDDRKINNAYDAYSNIGKKLQITEFDVSNDGKNKDFDYETNRVYRTVLNCAAKYGIQLFNLWGVSSKISWKGGKINCYLDDNGEVSPYAKKIVKGFSGKYKERKKSK